MRIFKQVLCSARLDEFGFTALYFRKGLCNFDDRDEKGKLAMLQRPLGSHFSKGKIILAIPIFIE